MALARAYVHLHEIAVVLQTSVPAARECLLSHGAIDVGEPARERFDPQSAARVVDELALSEQAQPLAPPILAGLLQGLIEVPPPVSVCDGSIPALEDLVTRLVAAHRERAQGGARPVASRCGS
jgi:hypothetical protein